MNEHMLKTNASSPIGRLLLASDGNALTAITFLGGAGDDFAVDPASRLDGVLRETAAQLDAYFAGRLRAFDLPLNPAGTEFQRSVWRALLEIGWGETVSYGNVARAIGFPKASRAVGAANGRNPIPIVIPCHRVIGANGTLTGYGGGLAIKEWLLNHEAAPCTGQASSVPEAVLALR